MSDDALRNEVMDVLLNKKALPSQPQSQSQSESQVVEEDPRMSAHKKGIGIPIVEKEEHLVTEQEDQKDELLEALADYAHSAWSGWMEHLFRKSATNEDGSVTIPKNLVDKWMKQLSTLYEDLSDEEKESDRKEARKIRKITGERKPSESNRKQKDLGASLQKVFENQSKIEMEGLNVATVEEDVRALLGKDKRKEIFEAMF